MGKFLTMGGDRGMLMLTMLRALWPFHSQVGYRAGSDGRVGYDRFGQKIRWPIFLMTSAGS